ncbi:MAG: HNH endonuclease [Actinomycetes bacterium]
MLARDGYICGICTLEIRQDVDVLHPLALTIDHIMPLAAGGADSVDNLQPAHRLCNVEKGDDLPAWWARRAVPA